MDKLSDKLEDAIQSETYGFFPIPITKYTAQNHAELKKGILQWMSKEDILQKHGRESICHGIAQVGDTNKLMNDYQELSDTIMDAVKKHNQASFNYKNELTVMESYLELASEGAIYAPHEHSNCVYSLTYLINYDSEKHAYVKWRKNVASNHYPILQLDSQDPTAFNLTDATFSMNEGDIIIYPSNVTHGFDSNPSNERITFTTNITIR